jgi:hypothetical protein
MKSGDGSDSSDDEPLIRHFLRQPELTLSALVVRGWVVELIFLPL